MPVINYNGQNTHTFRGANDSKYRFLPGANEVPGDVWEELQGNDGVQSFLARGMLVPVVVRQPSKAAPQGPGRLQKVGEGPMKNTPLEGLREANIALMDAWAAIRLVEGVIDLDHLKRYREQETQRKGGHRKTVLTALDTQIEALQSMEPVK